MDDNVGDMRKGGVEVVKVTRLACRSAKRGKRLIALWGNPPGRRASLQKSSDNKVVIGEAGQLLRVSVAAVDKSE